MSVIAKLMVRNVAEFGTGRLVELGCICENDLMAAHAGSEEDRLFTKYSPWGELKLSQQPGHILQGTFEWQPGDIAPPPAFYVMALHESEYEHIAPDLGPDRDRYAPDHNFPGAAAWAVGVCKSLTDFGGDSRRVEFQAGNGGTIKGRGVDALNWKMSVDNPLASNQFKPGERYYFAFYEAVKFDRNAAIAAAHGGKA